MPVKFERRKKEEPKVVEEVKTSKLAAARRTMSSLKLDETFKGEKIKEAMSKLKRRASVDVANSRKSSVDLEPVDLSSSASSSRNSLADGLRNFRHKSTTNLKGSKAKLIGRMKSIKKGTWIKRFKDFK